MRDIPLTIGTTVCEATNQLGFHASFCTLSSNYGTVGSVLLAVGAIALLLSLRVAIRKPYEI